MTGALAPIRRQRLFNRSPNHLTKMVANPGFVDLNHLAHRLHTILVTHRLLLHLEEAVKPESAKDTVRYL